MSRQVTEWAGQSPNSAIPPRVKLRVFERAGGKCAKCTRRLYPREWECDHIIPLIAGGRHAEGNLQPLCTSPCHSQKTRADVAEKSRNYRKRANHLGLKPARLAIKSQGFQKAKPQRKASTAVNKWRGF